MSKIETKTDKILDKYSLNLPGFMFVTGPIVGLVIGGILRAIFAEYVESNAGTWFVDCVLNYLPLILPIILLVGPYLLYFMIELLLSIFEPKNEIEDKKLQLILTSVTIVVALTVFLVNFVTWPTEFWQDATKSGNDSGISTLIADLFHFFVNNWQTALVALAIEIVASVSLAVLLKIGKGKNFKRFSRLVAKLELLSLISTVVLFFFNCFIYTSATVLMFCYSFALSFVLLPTFIKVLKHTCPFCHKYHCGKTLLSTETKTYIDHSDMRIVSSTDYKYAGDETTYRVNTYAPAEKTETRITLKCNACGKITHSYSAGASVLLF